MNTITILFTKNKFSIISWLVRLNNFKHELRISKSSHCIIFDSYKNIAYDSDILTGVKRGKLKDLLQGSTVVKQVTYSVPNSKAGIEFLEKQVGKKYDLLGSLNILNNRASSWRDDNSWYCYALAAATLHASGLDIFNDLTYINERQLLSLET